MNIKITMKVVWSCSDTAHHEHKTKIGAWLCGRYQYFLAKELERLTKREPDVCPACHGEKVVFDGILRQCPSCNGTGKRG